VFATISFNSDFNYGISISTISQMTLYDYRLVYSIIRLFIRKGYVTSTKILKNTKSLYGRRGNYVVNTDNDTANAL